MNFSFKVTQIRSQEGLLQNEVHLSYECNLQNIFVFKGVIPTRSEPYFMLFPMQNVSVKALQGLHKMRDMPFIWLVSVMPRTWQVSKFWVFIYFTDTFY